MKLNIFIKFENDQEMEIELQKQVPDISNIESELRARSFPVYPKPIDIKINRIDIDYLDEDDFGHQVVDVLLKILYGSPVSEFDYLKPDTQIWAWPSLQEGIVQEWENYPDDNDSYVCIEWYSEKYSGGFSGPKECFRNWYVLHPDS